MAAETAPAANVNELVEEARPAPRIDDKDYFHFVSGADENVRFWERFGGRPDVRGRRVLDVGSGWGRLCVELGLAGASRVVGLDLKPELVAFSEAVVQRDYPHLAPTVTFRAVDLRALTPPELFDLIVTKDSLEHILDPGTFLATLRAWLVPGGRVYAGFGPLYPSPYGDHDRRYTAFAPFGRLGRAVGSIPWAHLPLEDVVLALHDGRHGRSVKRVQDLELNGLGYSDYRRLFAESGLVLESLRTNQSRNPLSPALSLLARVPRLEDYCIHNVYAVLRRD